MKINNPNHKYYQRIINPVMDKSIAIRKVKLRKVSIIGWGG